MIELGKISVRKNILDLEHGSYLQYYKTTIIIISTYIVGLVVALVTKSIDFHDKSVIVILSIITAVFLSFSFILLTYFRGRMAEIYRKIRLIGK